MKVLKVGHGYIRDISTLLSNGAEVQENLVMIAGLSCREYIIGNKFRILKTTRNNAKAVLFERGQNGWEKTGLMSYAVLFLYHLVKFREWVFENNKQGGITNNLDG